MKDKKLYKWEINKIYDQVHKIPFDKMNNKAAKKVLRIPEK